MSVLNLLLAAASAAAPAPLQTVSGETLRQAAVQALKLPPGSELTLAAALPDLRLPTGELRLAAHPQPPRGARISVPLTLFVDGRPQRSIAVRFLLREPVAGLVYASDQRAHVPATAVQVKLGELDRRSAPDAVPAYFQPPADARLRRAVRAGAAVRSSDFVATPAVQRGTEVRLVAVSSGIRVSLKGVALADAVLGEPAAVRIGEQVLRGRVSDRGEVRTDG